MPENGDPCDRGADRPQELEPLGAELGLQYGQSCDVSAGPSEAHDVAGPDRIRMGDEDDGDRRCRRLRGPGEERAPRHDQVRLAPNQVRCEFWGPSGVACGPSELDQNILALDPAALLQAQAEGLPLTTFRRARGFGRKVPD